MIFDFCKEFFCVYSLKLFGVILRYFIDCVEVYFVFFVFVFLLYRYLQFFLVVLFIYVGMGLLGL